MAEIATFAECPKCRNRSLRISEMRTFGEHLRSLFGRYPMRCRHCGHRFETGVFTFADWRYARCPKCYRTELSTWSEQFYHPTWLITARLRLGATPYRCESCRCNFASFLACKERFSWRRRRPQEQPAVLESESEQSKVQPSA